MDRAALLLRLSELSRRLPAFRGKARLQRALTRVIVHSDSAANELSAYIGGVHWQLDLRELIQFRLLWDGSHDAHVLAWLGRRLSQRGVRQAVLWDVGANIGAISLLVAAAHPGVRVESFEPSPRVGARLAENIALNPQLDVHMHALALSDRSGTVAFHESAEPGNGGLGALYVAHNTDKIGIDVATLRGDELVANGKVPAPTVIKIDVEGFEPEVLDGLRDVLATHRPVLCVESSAYRLDGRGLARDAIVRRLEGLGYRVAMITERGDERPVTPADLDQNVDLAAHPI